MNSFRKTINGNVVFSCGPNAPCPCGSGKAISQCCLTKSGFRKAPASVAPIPPRTGEALQACYASHYADCSSKLSREHYISKSLLHYLNSAKDLRVNGLRWLEGEVKVMSPDALTSKVLCERHNSCLSALDEIAVRLFKAFDEEGATGSGQQLLYLFCGHDVERWLLKILCGLVYSKNIGHDVDCDFTIPVKWIDILFGYKDFSEEQGLYVCNTCGHRLEGKRGFTVQAIAGQKRLTGMGLGICGYEFILSMSGFPSRRFDGRQFIYRPMEFYTTGPDFEKSVLLSWDGPADLGSIHYKIA